MEDLLARVPVLLLISSRVAGIAMVSPVFANRFMPTRLRAAFAFMLGLLLLPAVQVDAGVLQATALIAAAALELLVGLIIGFFGVLVFAAVQMAGSMMDVDMGFSMAQILDPVTNRHEPLLGSFLQTLALVVYLALNAHHWLIRAVADSYLAVPAGGLLLAGAAAGPLHAVYFFGAMLAAAVKMVLPFIAVMLLLSATLAAMNRAVPHIHIFTVGLGAKALIGMVIITVLLPFLAGFWESLFQLGHRELLRTLELMR